MLDIVHPRIFPKFPKFRYIPYRISTGTPSNTETGRYQQERPHDRTLLWEDLPETHALKRDKRAYA